MSTRFVVAGNHARSDYLGLIKRLVERRQQEGEAWQPALDAAYRLLMQEIIANNRQPTQDISFGTSGWRGKLGKDIFADSVVMVTTAIVQMYAAIDHEPELGQLLGVGSFTAAKKRGCVLGFDNRFAGELLACRVAAVLVDAGFTIHYAGESTTGALSAAVLECGGAFSINLTPSHNPLEYGGYKFNAADGGPAASEVTKRIDSNVQRLVKEEFSGQAIAHLTLKELLTLESVHRFNSLNCWKELVKKNYHSHGLDLGKTVSSFLMRDDMVCVVDCVHGASRLHIQRLFGHSPCSRLIILRDNADVTFAGVAPEPSAANMGGIVETLKARGEALKLGAILDPDGDRIRFTDGQTEVGMNQFGAMAYHFLHEYKGKKGMVAKTVATSNLANSIAAAFKEEIFEGPVGFKNFKPVVDRALVYFEESDGISVIGHTPEKDAYIGLLIGLEIMLTTNMSLGDYLGMIEGKYGVYYPHRDGVAVSAQGDQLSLLLAGLDKYEEGSFVTVGNTPLRIKRVITLDGRKIIFADGSWLMIRPSGTEPKVRFYVESRTPGGTAELVSAAKNMLVEIGVL